MQHETKGGTVYSIYSIRDGYDTLLKIQYCKAENIRRIIRFYNAKYPQYRITPIIHYFKVLPLQDIRNTIKQIDKVLRPAPIYDHNKTPRANTKRLQKYLYNDFKITENFLINAIGDILNEYDEFNIFEDFHQQDETGDKFSYNDDYNAIIKAIQGAINE